MKKLGLIGGVGPVSTIEYYKSINDGYQKHLAQYRSSKSGENPPMIIESLNIATAYELVAKKDWKNFADLFIAAVNNLHKAGADFAAIAANTAHIVFDEIEANSPIPLVGIIDETCKVAEALACKKVIVIGTEFTMKSRMYETKLSKFGIEGIVPCDADKKAVHDIIFPNLEARIVLEHEKEAVLEIVRRMLCEHKADTVVLGCTELNLIIKDDDLDAILIDTAKVHIDAILKNILS